MKPGSFCRPSSEGEWRAIIDLARSMALGNVFSYAPFCATTRIYFEGLPSIELSCRDFIAGMYEEAEKRKTFDPEKVFITAPMEAFDLEKRIKELEGRTDQLARAISGPNNSIFGDGTQPLIPDIKPKLSDSPQNLGFEVALQYLKAGRRIRRSSWDSATTPVCLLAKQLVVSDGAGPVKWIPSTDCLMANDWCVIDEPTTT